MHNADLEAHLQKAADDLEKIDLLNEIAYLTFQQNPQRNAACMEQAGKLLQQHPAYARGQANYHINAGLQNRLKGEYDQAITQFTEAVKLCQKLADSRSLARALDGLGISYALGGDQAAGMEFLLQALDSLESLGSKYDQAHVLHSIGRTYLISNQYDQAIAAFSRALQLAEEIQDYFGIALRLNNIAAAYWRISDYAAALENAQKSLKIAQEHQFYYVQHLALMNMASARQGLGENQKALEALDQCFNVLKTHHKEAGLGPYEESQDHYYAANIYIRQQNLPAALSHLEESLRLAQECNYRQVEYECHERLAEIYEQQGDFQKALAHHKRFHQVKEQVFNDTSERTFRNLRLTLQVKQAQDEAERQRQLREEDRRYFEELNRLKDEFIHTASHDLKNPLAVIFNSVFLLERYLNTSETRIVNHLNKIRDSAERIRSLIADILELAKLETGRALNLSTVDVPHYLNTIIEAFTPIAASKALALKLDMGPMDRFHQFDPGLIQRALENLLSNAIKYTAEGGLITLRVRQNESELVITVEDTGLGIPSEALPRLFNRFYRVQRKEHLAIEGTGLGLAIVKAIIEQHGGSVAVKSKLGKGTTFTLKIPTAQELVSSMA
ncbi:MAG: tetratricopeptide repeat-containing sensor histidine kinase [Anaerolineae bacterium]|nr:tetratricopeptide repeat-containing sensor histidine kinase [Anaerolineae bacterium]